MARSGQSKWTRSGLLGLGSSLPAVPVRSDQRPTARTVARAKAMPRYRSAPAASTRPAGPFPIAACWESPAPRRPVRTGVWPAGVSRVDPSRASRAGSSESLMPTSKKAGKAASNVLRDKKSTVVENRAAASDLAQRPRKTGKKWRDDHS